MSVVTPAGAYPSPYANPLTGGASRPSCFTAYPAVMRKPAAVNPSWRGRGFQRRPGSAQRMGAGLAQTPRTQAALAAHSGGAPCEGGAPVGQVSEGRRDEKRIKCVPIVRACAEAELAAARTGTDIVVRWKREKARCGTLKRRGGRDAHGGRVGTRTGGSTQNQCNTMRANARRTSNTVTSFIHPPSQQYGEGLLPDKLQATSAAYVHKEEKSMRPLNYKEFFGQRSWSLGPQDFLAAFCNGIPREGGMQVRLTRVLRSGGHDITLALGGRATRDGARRCAVGRLYRGIMINSEAKGRRRSVEECKRVNPPSRQKFGWFRRIHDAFRRINAAFAALIPKDAIGALGWN
ncbi:hypothetical protein C8F04DRAFT_1184649 [Mycena alexandri]|uniref:Uncharacterized protein n=1 Tax=Mycena alexandri TaxID=1745969 RepID=A0AAD6SRX0_9AGAR|nr:hypothetical protein C8F04DRAFT_1184649 [Mycena alexandri]